MISQAALRSREKRSGFMNIGRARVQMTAVSVVIMVEIRKCEDVVSKTRKKTFFQ